MKSKYVGDKINFYKNIKIIIKKIFIVCNK